MKAASPDLLPPLGPVQSLRSHEAHAQDDRRAEECLSETGD